MNKVAVIAACVFTVGALSAENTAAPKSELFSKMELKTFKGQLKEVQKIKHENMEGVHLVLDVDGKPVVVLLGPAFFVEELQFNPKTGDTLEVTGFVIESAKEEPVIGKSIKANDKEFKFRDDSGIPAWRGWRSKG